MTDREGTFIFLLPGERTLIKYSRDTQCKNNNPLFYRITKTFLADFYDSDEVRGKREGALKFMTFVSYMLVVNGEWQVGSNTNYSPFPNSLLTYSRGHPTPLVIPRVGPGTHFEQNHFTGPSRGISLEIKKG